MWLNLPHTVAKVLDQFGLSTRQQLQFYAMMAAMARPKLFLIDTFGFIFRAYHARARSRRAADADHHGHFDRGRLHLQQHAAEAVSEHKPAYIAAIFESPSRRSGPSRFAEYKANRAEMPPGPC